jgi:hypothetical protein
LGSICLISRGQPAAGIGTGKIAVDRMGQASQATPALVFVNTFLATGYGDIPPAKGSQEVTVPKEVGQVLLKHISDHDGQSAARNQIAV